MSEWATVNSNGDANETTRKLKIKGGYLYCHVMKWKNDNGWLTQMALCFVPDEEDE